MAEARARLVEALAAHAPDDEAFDSFEELRW
jgi:hypothetical protein